ncbi:MULTISPECIES: copper resistance CopC family protein [unclassified Curtobacterium]|uniref:copper resistance CopC family protein n=1 Tax=unclassified Curtobacterium TaxID=257496 RepID=UPI0008DD5B1D|nr:MULTISPECIES: copper resistance CopC family protein [unclassified Curtobacterium]WIA96765.1 copper resistance protein CopC [Curtobacterium sp. MCBA15_004]WIB00067.1 copper resistance protein CopC [Curtobacterium sp. MCBA15_012]
MRLRALLATVVVAALAPVVLLAGPASAHDVLVSSDPAADAAVSGDLDVVTLTLSEEPLSGLQTGIVISVTDAAGAEHTSGEVRVSGTTIAKPVDLATPGTYRVQWRSVSVDGHPISGEYRFTSTGATTPLPTGAPSASASAAAPAAEPTPTAATSTAVAATAGHQHGGSTPWVLGGIVVVALAAVLVTRLVQRRRPTADGAGSASADVTGTDQG